MNQADFLRLLVSRLERLSVDSRWARRASGLRGNLLKVMDALEQGLEIPPARLDGLIESAFDILRKSAQEIPDFDATRR